MKVENLFVSSESIDHCPWNPRGEITPESVADLTASIKERGLLQEIGVMKRPGGGERYWAIYGNRRLVACREFGLEFIPCKVYEVNEAEAREITRIENEVRLGISPIKDAELVKSMLDLGMTESDIAAHFGVSVPTICRRAKLITLSDDYKALADKITTAALENIAAYTDEIQKACLKSVKNQINYAQGQVGWKSISSKFEQETANLDGAHFINYALDHDSNVPEKCLNCQKRTGCMADLFGELDEDGSLGRCLDTKCFKETSEAFIVHLAAEKIDRRATESIRVNHSWDMPNGVVNKWSKKNPCAYWLYENWNWKDSKDDGIVVKYGPSKAMIDAIKREQKEAERIEAERRNADRKLLSSAREKIVGMFTNCDNRTAFNRALSLIQQPELHACRKWFLEQIFEQEFAGCNWGEHHDARNAEIVRLFTADVIGLTDEEAKAIAEAGKEEVPDPLADDPEEDDGEE